MFGFGLDVIVIGEDAGNRLSQKRLSSSKLQPFKVCIFSAHFPFLHSGRKQVIKASMKLKFAYKSALKHLLKMKKCFRDRHDFIVSDFIDPAGIERYCNVQETLFQYRNVIN